MMTSSQPLVSIVIPTKDREDWLLEAVDSVLKQTCPDWQTIIVDDGTAESVRQRIRGTLKLDPRVLYLERKGTMTGAPACRNQGLQAARGEFVVFLDDDDLLAPDCLERRIDILESRPDLDFIVSPCQIFRNVPEDTPFLHNIETAQNALDRFLCLDVPWQTAAVLWRRNSLKKMGGWDEQLPSFQDWDFHIRALAAGLSFEWSGRHPDCFWRQPAVGNQTIGARSQSAEHLENHFGLFCALPNILRDAQMLTDNRRELVAGLFFWLAEAWLKLGRLDRSVDVWEKCNEMNICSDDVHRMGMSILKSTPRLFARRVLREIFFLPYPRKLCAGDYSTTSRRCKV